MGTPPIRQPGARQVGQCVFLDRGLTLPRNLVQTNSHPVITNLLRAVQSAMIAPLPREAVQSECDRGDLTVLTEDVGLVIGVASASSRAAITGSRLVHKSCWKHFREVRRRVLLRRTAGEAVPASHSVWRTASITGEADLGPI